MRLLGPRAGIRLGVLGSGLEAQTHVEAPATVCEIDSMRVFSPTAKNLAAFANRFADEFGFDAAASETPEAAMRGATHIIAAARSCDESPVLRAEMIAPGALVASIGRRPEMRSIFRENRALIHDRSPLVPSR